MPLNRRPGFPFYALLLMFLAAAPFAAADQPPAAPATPASADPCLKYLPADWWLVGNFDAGQFMAFMKSAEANNPQAAVFEQYMVMVQQFTGINFKTDVRYITCFATGEPGDKSSALVIINGTFDNQVASARLAASPFAANLVKTAYQNNAIYESNGTGYTFTEPSTLVIGTSAGLRSACDAAAAAPTKLSDSLQKTLDRTDGASIAWVAVRPQAILKAPLVADWRHDNADLADNLKTVDCMSVFFDEAPDGILVTALGNLPTAPQAQHLHDFLTQYKQDLLTHKGVNVFLASFLVMSDLRLETTQVRGNLRMTAQAISELWNTKVIVKPPEKP